MPSVHSIIAQTPGAFKFLGVSFEPSRGSTGPANEVRAGLKNLNKTISGVSA